MKYQVEKACEILSVTPEVLRAILESLSDEWTLKANDTNSWSAFDIIGHLIHGEKTDWIPRAKIILEQGENITFEPFDRTAQFKFSRGETLGQLLERFETLRRQNIKILKQMNITEDQLKLKGIHPELGEVNLEQLLATWVVHDLNHIRQISVGLAAKYADNVGVWREYLSILK